MFAEDEFSIFDLVSGLSELVDLYSPELDSHHKKVAYIAYNIAAEMGLSDAQIKNIVLASLLHDIGAFTTEERLNVVHASFDDHEFNGHQMLGYKLLNNFEPLATAAQLVKYHHVHYNKATGDIPIGSYIIHLADRLSIAYNVQTEILAQVPGIMHKFSNNNSIFHPDTVDALLKVAKREYFWIEACLLPINTVLPERMRFSKEKIDLNDLRDLAKVIAQVIDFRSRFTSTHSSGVAAAAFELANIYGFSKRECKLMEIAGYLHDLGKLAISNDILEKNGALNHEEFNEMRKHSYYTYAVLNKIKGFEQIAMWAAYHHERLDGNGYPFHIKGDDFIKLARIMAVADIVTAITEDRPYRKGMSSDKAIAVLIEMAENGGIDRGTVRIVTENFTRINAVRIIAQQQALVEYNAFNDAFNDTYYYIK